MPFREEGDARRVASADEGEEAISRARLDAVHVTHPAQRLVEQVEVEHAEVVAEQHQLAVRNGDQSTNIE